MCNQLWTEPQPCENLPFHKSNISFVNHPVIDHRLNNTDVSDPVVLHHIDWLNLIKQSSFGVPRI